MSPRRIIFAALLVLSLVAASWFAEHRSRGWVIVALVAIWALALADTQQTRHAIRRNFPLIGRLRWLFEEVRPELQQYFIETNISGKPFSHEQRSLVYQRAKSALDTQPFGTEHDVYAPGYEWLEHSLAATHAGPHVPRVRVGGADCMQPYEAQLLNISAMSYGALSINAILALNGGAKLGGFAHNTGEGGLSPYHLEPGGDVIWQLGTGYFGARDLDGRFSPDLFRDNACKAQVKMIEIKLSQGAKPGHGGILPAGKVSLEISKIRNVPMGKDVVSPPTHSEFSTPLEFCAFVAKLRDLSGGKPVGFKLCVGRRHEFFALCKAMIQTGVYPDFVTVDGGEGGTGAAPVEFANHVGSPLEDALVFVHNALVGLGIRDRIRIVASGKNVSGFDMAKRMALGADICNAARAMMLALGCIQAQRCNNNTCPTGIATQDPELVQGLDVSDKRVRVQRFQAATVRALGDLVAAAGLSTPRDLQPHHIRRRLSAHESRSLAELYPRLALGALLAGGAPAEYMQEWERAQSHTFAAAEG